ncbi:CHASE4 domain-containing protein [Chloroflexota bacterium]
MTLRRQMLLIISAATICLVAFVYVASRFVLLDELEEIEEYETYKNMERTLGIVYKDISDLETVTQDWSSWDDTYAFIDTGDDTYIQSNLVMATFINLKLNLMLFINSSGQTIFGKAVDLTSEEEVPIPAGIIEYLADNRPSLEQPGAVGIKSGFILLKEGPILIASRPILTSEDEGPARGTVIFGYHFDQVKRERLSQLALLPVYVQSIDELRMYPDFAKAFGHLLAGETIFTLPLNTKYVAGYALVDDVYGDPIFVLRVDTPRDIYQQGEASVAYYIVVVLGIGLSVAGAVFLILQRQVFSRFTQLINDVNGIAGTGKLSTRIQLTGSDELTTIAGTINGMLGALEESGTKIKKQYEQERELRREVEIEMNRRVEFTRALVHELKTPITPVMAASELLLEESKEAVVTKLAQSIHRGALNLNKRIDELLDLARSEVGVLSMNIMPLDPMKAIQNVFDGMLPLALERGQLMVLEVAPSLPIIQVDSDRFTQILQNLLNNALKFAPEGGKIVVRCKVEEANIIIEVQDNGPGVSKEEQERIFDPYHRLPGDRERFSGLGLGLALSKKFIELHGGKIWIRSKKGVGSTFGFSIPIESNNRIKGEAEPR